MLTSTPTLDGLRESLKSYRSTMMGQARALPMAAYTSQDLFQLEAEEIFRKEWICVGRDEQVREIGDWFTTEIAGEPIVITRDEDNEVRALSSICRHRYMSIANGAGNSRRLTCPYHRWSYSLDGSLRGAPLMDEPVNSDGGSCKLPSFALESWLGFIFVNLAEDPAPLAPKLEGAEATLAPYGIKDWRILISFDEVWAGNWKLALETALEGYHLDGLHAGEIAEMLPSKGAKFIEATKQWSCFRLDVNFESAFGEPAKPFAKAMGGTDATSSPTVSIHPHVNISCTPASSTWLTFMPLEPGRTRVQGAYLVPAAEYERIHQAEGELEMTQQVLAQLNREDSSAMVDLQRNAGSRFAEPGLLNEREEALVHFYRYLADRLISVEGPAQ